MKGCSHFIFIQSSNQNLRSKLNARTENKTLSCSVIFYFEKLILGLIREVVNKLNFYGLIRYSDEHFPCVSVEQQLINRRNKGGGTNNGRLRGSNRPYQPAVVCISN